jgi:hypothetical protein
MAIGRRNLLALSGAVAISAAMSSCSDAREDAGRPSPSPGGPTTEPPATSPPATFPAQPPPGTLYFGASVPHSRSVTAWEDSLGATLALRRSFFSPDRDRDETALLVRRCRDDLAHGRLPHVSVKPAWAWEEIAKGAHDRWLRRMLRPLGELAAPVFFTLHHEPENEAGPPGMQASDFVAMQQRLLDLAADLCPQVSVVPIMQHWTFDPLRDDVDPSTWIVPGVPVIGLDIYNPWSPGNGKEWRTFGSKCDEVIGWFGDTPLAIGEYGTQEDPENPGLATEWLRDAAEYARSHNFVSMSYFNSITNSPDGSYALRGQTEQAFAELLASDWVARVA